MDNSSVRIDLPCWGLECEILRLVEWIVELRRNIFSDVLSGALRQEKQYRDSDVDRDQVRNAVAGSRRRMQILRSIKPSTMVESW
jgi:hypothetical protein